MDRTQMEIVTFCVLFESNKYITWQKLHDHANLLCGSLNIECQLFVSNNVKKITSEKERQLNIDFIQFIIIINFLIVFLILFFVIFLKFEYDIVIFTAAVVNVDAWNDEKIKFLCQNYFCNPQFVNLHYYKILEWFFSAMLFVV